MSIRYEWQVAEQVQPTAQRHTDVPAWMRSWDTWSVHTLAELKLAEDREVAERAAARELRAAG